MKQQFVEQLKDGTRIDDCFMVKSVRMSETRTGKPYMVLVVMDKTGSVSGNIWDEAEKYQEICKIGSVVQIVGVVQTYREKIQLKINSIAKVADDAVELGDFQASSKKDAVDMVTDLNVLIKSVDNSWLKKLLKRFFNDKAIKQGFVNAPAAKGIHHAYLGGLLEHSVSVAKLAASISFHYDGVDRSLLIAGALLHDIGKLEELGCDAAVIDYTTPGRLKGHLVIGSEMVASEAKKIKNFPDELLEHLQHMILSHHGRQEFGSPVVPMTVEALLLSFVDELDAKMNLMEQLRYKMKNTGMEWTEYQRSLERYLFLSRLDDKEDNIEKTGETIKQDLESKQGNLF